MPRRGGYAATMDTPERDDGNVREPLDSPETVSEDEEGAVGDLGLPDLTGDDDE